MDEEKAQNDISEMREREPYRVRLPGFITDEEIGLGDVIKRCTGYVRHVTHDEIADAVG